MEPVNRWVWIGARHVLACLRANFGSAWGMATALSMAGFCVGLLLSLNWRAGLATEASAADPLDIPLLMWLLLVVTVPFDLRGRLGWRGSTVDGALVNPAALPALPIPPGLRAALDGLVIWGMMLPATWLFLAITYSPVHAARLVGYAPETITARQLLWIELLLAATLSLPLALTCTAPARGSRARLMAKLCVVGLACAGLFAGWPARPLLWVAATLIVAVGSFAVLRSTCRDLPTGRALDRVSYAAAGAFRREETKPTPGAVGSVPASLLVQALLCGAIGGLLGLSLRRASATLADDWLTLLSPTAFAVFAPVASWVRSLREDPWKVSVGSGVVAGPREAPQPWARAWEMLPVERQRLARWMLCHQFTVCAGILSGGLSVLFAAEWVTSVPTSVLAGTILASIGIPVVTLEGAGFVPRRWLWAAASLGVMGIWSVCVGGVLTSVGAPQDVRIAVLGIVNGPGALAAVWWSRDLIFPWVFSVR